LRKPNKAKTLVVAVPNSEEKIVTANFQTPQPRTFTPKARDSSQKAILIPEPQPQPLPQQNSVLSYNNLSYNITSGTSGTSGGISGLTTPETHIINELKHKNKENLTHISDLDSEINRLEEETKLNEIKKK